MLQRYPDYMDNLWRGGNVVHGEFGCRAWLRVVFSEEEQQRWQ